ncbi:hypothetical protein V6N13_037014 [Hibiscus sabdariffa]
MESVGLREANVESPGQGSFGVAYASLGKSEPWPCLVGRGVHDPSPCVATVQLGGVSRPSNVRASARSMSQWRLWCVLAHCFLRSSIESFTRVGCGPVVVDAATSTQWACEW